MNKQKTTIRKRVKNDQELIISQLKKTPIIQIACEKTSIGRSTYYRWLEKCPDFAKKARGAIKEGESLVSDLAESQLISAIRDRNLTSIIFWLKNHDPVYSDKVELTTSRNEEEKLTPEQQKLIEKALAMLKDDDIQKKD
ncbi:MAG: hypothetical protein JW991_00615 [Candidatus Pacebacteria bacterium]|nr:hypothetical protein [Candidatus Paceibacterota bacterium]